MSEITAGVTVVEDVYDVLKALVSHSSLADEIKAAAHKVIDGEKATDPSAAPAQPSAQEVAERAQLAELQAKYATVAAPPAVPPVASGVPVTPPREGM